MKNPKQWIAILVIFASLALFNLTAHFSFAQEQEIKPVVVEQPMPDFTLPTYQGDTVTLSKLKGKNVLILFPRGYAAEGRWCTICNYRYAELVELEKAAGIREKYNTEILVVLPYSKEIVQAWLDSFPEQLEKIRTWKNPPDPDKLDEAGKQRTARSKVIFPKDIIWEKGEVPAPFPILIDAERKVSKGLGLFATEWSGSKVDQNIPSVYVVDKNGVLQFKYIGQNTFDRPGYEYLIKVLAAVNSR